MKNDLVIKLLDALVVVASGVMALLFLVGLGMLIALAIA